MPCSQIHIWLIYLSDKFSPPCFLQCRLLSASWMVLLISGAIHLETVHASDDDLYDAPHPSCLDFDPQTSLRNDFLTEPLDLTCNQGSPDEDVFDYFGFTTYERPRDPAGEHLGSHGYQRFTAKDNVALYLLRTESGGNAVSTAILTGREIKKSNKYLLVDGQIHSTGEDCQGVTDVWTETNDDIYISVELSTYETLQAMLLPHSGPPSSGQKTKFLNALLSQQNDDYLDYQRTCSVAATYRLNSLNLQLQLTSIQFNINDEPSDAAFQWFKSLMPASDNLDVGILLEHDLVYVHNKLLMSVKDQYQFDEPDMPSGTLSTFLAQLKTAVQQKNIKALLKMTAEDVMLGFGGSGGHQDLQSWLSHDNADEDWQSLNEMLSLPGVHMSSAVYCLPHPGCISNDLTGFSYDTFITTNIETPLLTLPSDNARVLRKLNFERVEWQYPYDENAKFRLVQTFAGERGYVNTAMLRSPFDIRMELALTETGWLVRSILSGD